jgi:hypothetical protein
MDHLTSWQIAVSYHASLVRSNAPASQQRKAHNKVKSSLVRVMVDMGYDFDDTMDLVVLDDSEFED